jgi:hypothetical protein
MITSQSSTHSQYLHVQVANKRDELGQMFMTMQNAHQIDSVSTSNVEVSDAMRNDEQVK